MPETLEEVRARALSLHMRGSLSEAEQLYRRLLRHSPADAAVLAQLGVLAAQTTRHAEAQQLLRAALRIDDRQVLAHNALGVMLTRADAYEAAMQSLNRAIALAPQFAEAWCNRGALMVHMHRLPEALHDFEQAVRCQPGLLSASLNRAIVLRELQRLPEALAALEHTLSIEPAHGEALVQKAAVLLALGHSDSALACYQRAHALRTDDVYALVGMAAALVQLRRPQEGLRQCDEAIALDAQCVEAHVNRALALQDLQRYEEALQSAERALQLDPQHVAALNNRATILQQLERHEEALQSLARAAQLQPQNPDVQFNQGLALLLLGRFEVGWPLYEWRKRRRPALGARAVPLPLLSRETALAGKHIYLHAEQGLGDTLHFCRYAPWLRQRGAAVTLAVQRPLCRLMQSLPGGIEIVALDSGNTPRADCHAPLLSLPWILTPRAEQVPAAIPYLRAEAERVQRWRRLLGSHGLRVGLCWQGDRGKVDVGRSLPLAVFEPLSKIEGVRLISLQKGEGLEQIGDLPEGAVEMLPGLDESEDAFLDSAAVVESLDLIITSDTALAHLAGALARPVWVLLKRVPDWRWMIEREDSPWYPSMRLFRQCRRGDWAELMQRVAGELTLLLQTGARR